MLIEATVSKERRGYIAIDDIMVLNYPCCKWIAVTEDAAGKKYLAFFSWGGGKTDFKAAWNINVMRRRVMADWPFILVRQALPGHAVTTAALLRHCDTQMPTLPSTWEHTCRFASSTLWQADLFVNQCNLRFSLCESFCIFMLLTHKEVFYI